MSMVCCYPFIKIGFLTIVIVSLLPYYGHLQDDSFTPEATCVATAPTPELAKKLAQTFCAGIVGGDQQAWQEDRRLNLERPPFLRASPHQPIIHFLGISNGKREYEPPLVMLIDNLQVPFRIEGGEEKLVHRLKVPLGNFAFQFEIPGLSTGLHDVVLIIFEEVFEGENFIATLFAGESIYVGEGDPPFVSEARPPDSAFKRIGRPGPPDNPLICDLSPIPNPTEKQIEKNRESHAKPQQQVNYYIEIITDEDFPPDLNETAVTVLLDWQQIPLSDGILLEHLLLERSWYVELPAKLIAPEKPGRYPLQLLVLMNPYQIHPHHGDNPKPTLFLSAVMASNSIWLLKEKITSNLEKS